MLRGGATISQNMPSGRPKRPSWWLYSSVAIILLLIFAVLFEAVGRHIVRSTLEHVYTPPALTREKLVVYTRFVTLVERHPEHRAVFLNMRGDFRVDLPTYSVTTPESIREVQQKTALSLDEVAELGVISKGFRRVGCVRAETQGAYVAFTSKRNYLMPSSPGVLYSFDGHNPNEVDDELLNRGKPFILVKDRWYMSRRLVTSPWRRIDAEWPLPQSLVDHSLRDPGPIPPERSK